MKANDTDNYEGRQRELAAGETGGAGFATLSWRSGHNNKSLRRSKRSYKMSDTTMIKQILLTRQSSAYSRVTFNRRNTYFNRLA